jgi:class 3 adenylate cyclase
MTDIEGSTALLERLGDGYGEVLDGVQTVLRTAVSAAHGHVIEVRADELFAVFEDPADAARTAVAAQRELGARTWDGGTVVRVRIGLHAGYPTRVRDNYIGMAVHVAARVSEAAHGGQVLVSGDTKTALTGLRLEGVRFRSLGLYRLRGIRGEVSLYQVVAKGLRATFPPPRTVRAAS